MSDSLMRKLRKDVDALRGVSQEPTTGISYLSIARDIEDALDVISLRETTPAITGEMKKIIEKALDAWAEDEAHLRDTGDLPSAHDISLAARWVVARLAESEHPPEIPISTLGLMATYFWNECERWVIRAKGNRYVLFQDVRVVSVLPPPEMEIYPDEHSANFALVIKGLVVALATAPNLYPRPIDDAAVERAIKAFNGLEPARTRMRRALLAFVKGE